MNISSTSDFQDRSDYTEFLDTKGRFIFGQSTFQPGPEPIFDHSFTDLPNYNRFMIRRLA